MSKIADDIFENTETAFASKSDADLQKSKALYTIISNNSLVSLGVSLANFALKLHLPVSPLFKFSVYEQFCGGETFEECKLTISKLDKNAVGVLLNYGVELKESENDFKKSLQQNLEAIDFASKNKSVKAICIKPTGYGRLELFEKIQSGEQLSTDETDEFERVKNRFEIVCNAALKKNVALYFDAEESWIQDTLDELVEELMQKYNRENCIVFNSFQLYRHDRLAYLKQQIEKSKAEKYFLGAKLVRGAYMEKERERAQEKNYPSPIHENKKDVDEDFDEAVKICLNNLTTVFLCAASHSEPSNLLAIQEMEKRKIPFSTERVVFSQLFGMGDNITFNLAQLGFNSTKYLPYGPVREVIPYLIRRAEENTSVAGQTGRELSLLKNEIQRRKNC